MALRPFHVEQREVCSVVNCDKIVEKRNGVCEMHYMRMRRNKDFYQKRSTTKPIEFEINENGCFIVTSHYPLSNGYFLIGKRGVRKSIHRLIYEECFGEISDGQVVRHKCDVRSCINPEHLEAGTQADNMRDAVERNRTLRGEANPRSKLSEETARSIKARITEGKRNCDIAKEFNIHKSVVCNIKRGSSWKYIS